MPDVTETEQGKQGQRLNEKFGMAVEALSQDPARLARVLSYIYGSGRKLKPESIESQLHLRGFLSFLESSAKKIPDNQQIAGFIAYTEWKLGWRPHKDVVHPILQAWNECGEGAMNEAVAELIRAEDSPLQHPLFQWPKAPEKPMLALPAPQPQIRPDYIRAVYVNSNPPFYRRLRNDDEHLQLASIYGRVLELKPPCA